jgi:hypothetical protein
MSDLIRAIAELVNSSNAFEKVGAMLAIEEVRSSHNTNTAAMALIDFANFIIHKGH